MEETWIAIPAFRADYHSLLWFQDGDLNALDWESLADLRPPRPKSEANHGWMCVYPTWFSYRYVRDRAVFDISEYPTEVRLNGSRCFKYNQFVGSVIEQIPRDEQMRQSWLGHYVFSAWQIDFVRRLNPSPELAQLLLPTALRQTGYRILGDAEIDELKCVHLELPGQDELWLAPSRSWNCVRRRFRPHGKPEDNEHWSLTRQWDYSLIHGRYLPKRVVVAKQVAKHRLAIHCLEVSAYEPIPNESAIPPRVRGAVWLTVNFATGKRETQIVPGTSPNTLEAIVGRLRTRMPTHSTNYWLYGCLFATVVASTIAILSAMVRKTSF
jgi:hypothetical protein